MSNSSLQTVSSGRLRPRTFRRGASLACLAFLALVPLVGCGQPAVQKEAKAVEVTVTTPTESKDVVDSQDYTGRLDAKMTVDIRPRVTGYVMSTPFKEGDLVKKDDILFKIDDRTYRADYDQAEANLRLAEADRNLQQRNAERARRLLTTASIAREEYDAILAAEEKAGRNIEALKATRDRTKLYLDFTEVRAPFSGRISRRNVDPGNLVNAETTLLTTLVSEDPVYAYFDVDERTYLTLLETASTQGQTGTPKFRVLLRLAHQENFTLDPGDVDFIDNRVNGNTGTVRMRGVFRNPMNVLKAGLFVRITLPVSEKYSALLIPDEAIMSDQTRKHIYVLNKDNEVAYREVTLGQTMGHLRVLSPRKFKLSPKEIHDLESKGIPAEVVAKLQPERQSGPQGGLVPEEGNLSEEKFLQALGKVLSPEELKKYRAPLLAAAIKEGVWPTDRVVISGMQKVRPGTKVAVKDQPAAAPPNSPLAAALEKK